jgi:hypothetical protein
MNEDEIEISIIQTPLSKPGQVEFGVKIVRQKINTQITCSSS